MKSREKTKKLRSKGYNVVALRKMGLYGDPKKRSLSFERQMAYELSDLDRERSAMTAFTVNGKYKLLTYREGGQEVYNLWSGLWTLYSLNNIGKYYKGQGDAWTRKIGQGCTRRAAHGNTRHTYDECVVKGEIGALLVVVPKNDSQMAKSLVKEAKYLAKKYSLPLKIQEED